MAKKTTATTTKAVKKQPKIITTVDIDGVTHIMIGVDLTQTGKVDEIPIRVKEFVSDMQDGKICRDVLIQRTDDQWTNQQKSALIASILAGRPIGSILTAIGRSESQSYTQNSLIDGLQRSTAIYDYCTDKFKLSSKIKPIRCRFKNESGEIISHTYEVAGKKLSQLPEVLKDTILNYRLTTYSYKGFTDDELDDIVCCVNGGKSPNSYQKMRFALGSENMRLLQPICDSTLWEDVGKCKAKNDSILCCVLRILMLYRFGSSVDLGSGAMNKFIDTFIDSINTITINEVKNYVEELAEIKFKMTDVELETLDACSIPHIIVNVYKFNHTDTDKTYLDCYRAFLTSDDYKKFFELCQSGSGGLQYASTTVEKRQHIIDNFLYNYLGYTLDEDNDTNEAESDTEISKAG